MGILTSFRNMFRPAPPIRAARPVVARGVRGFDIADTGRLFSSWLANNDSADQGIKNKARLARARSRELAENNEYVKGFLRLLANNVVGPDGFKLQVKAMDVSAKGEESLDERANRLVELAWKKWSKNKRFVHRTRRLNFTMFCRLAAQAVAREGEIFVVMYRDDDRWNPFRFTLGLLEADYLDLDHNVPDLGGGRSIIMGVEVDAAGAPLAYHFFKKHPGDGIVTERVRVPAEDVLHLFVPDRPSATRGMPWFTASGPTLKMVGGYEEAEVVAARVSASKMGFFTNPDGEASGLGDEETDEGDFLQDVQPGRFGVLPSGYDFKEFDPTHPGANFDAFCKHQLRKAAVGLGVSYTSFGNNLEGTSYSSIRQGALDERDGWMVLQNWLIAELCEPVFERWLEAALLTQAVPLPMAKFDKFNAPQFKGRRWTWIDPQKDANGNQIELSSGQATVNDLVGEKGVDYEDHIKQLAKEVEDFKAMGLVHPAAASAAKAQGGNDGKQNDQKQDADQAV